MAKFDINNLQFSTTKLTRQTRQSVRDKLKQVIDYTAKNHCMLQDGFDIFYDSTKPNAVGTCWIVFGDGEICRYKAAPVKGLTMPDKIIFAVCD